VARYGQLPWPESCALLSRTACRMVPARAGLPVSLPTCGRTVFASDHVLLEREVAVQHVALVAAGILDLCLIKVGAQQVLRIVSRH